MTHAPPSQPFMFAQVDVLVAAYDQDTCVVDGPLAESGLQHSRRIRHVLSLWNRN